MSKEQKCVEALGKIIDFAEAKIERLECELAAYRWISVSERLPEERGYIIVIESEIMAASCFFFSNTDKVRSWLKEKYTHWMPIPPLPPQDIAGQPGEEPSE